MRYRSNEKIRVWEYYVSVTGEVEWQQTDTSARVGTQDEHYFWRVTNSTGKQFFISPEQWMDYSGNDGEGIEEIVAKWYERYNQLMKEES